MSFTNVGKSCPSRAQIFNVINMSFDAFRENFRIYSIKAL